MVFLYLTQLQQKDKKNENIEIHNPLEFPIFNDNDFRAGVHIFI